MIHIVTASNRHLYRAQLAEMHQLRRVHFIEELGWKDLRVAADGGEYDQYDDERTVYIMALGANAEILCSLRARPTDDKCMLTDIFPELIGPDQEPLNGANVWELGRNFTTYAARRMKRANGRKVYLDLLMATFEWLESVGVERVVGICDLHWYPMCREWGWNIRMTGLPLETIDGTIIGIEGANTAADVDAFRRINGFGPRTAHVVTDEDIAVFGTLENIEAEFELLRGDLTQPVGSAGRPVNRSA
jgi:acyl-homoserine lactone synthase